MTGDEAFAALRARREAERAAQVKVTWRRVHKLTGGGWSGLGPGGRLVFVALNAPGDGYHFGTVEGSARTVRGAAITVTSAKAAAAALLAPKEAS